MSYEDRQKRERDAANKAINDMKVDEDKLKEIENINIKDWDF